MVLKKCRFNKECKIYRETNYRCRNEGKGRAFQKHPQCFKDMQEIENIKNGLVILSKNPIVHSGSIKIMEERLKQLTDE